MRKEWEILDTEEVCNTGLFIIERLASRRIADGRESFFFRMKSRDWVNVVPVTDEGRVILIRQFRQGIQDWTVEIPGGVLESGEEPSAGALRELREETGYLAREIRYLTAVRPNPALQDNQCHLFMALGVWHGADVDFDPDENIETMEVSLAQAWDMARTGQISNVMAAAAIAFAMGELGVLAFDSGRFNGVK